MSAYYTIGYNQQPFTVRLDRAPRPITEPELRFSRRIKTIEIEGETHRVWTGGESFNMGDGRAVTPKRAAVELAEMDLPLHSRLPMSCKVPGCVALSHMIFDET
jgi:hypothetical protein